jgi:hypothetical protein
MVVQDEIYRRRYCASVPISWMFISTLASPAMSSPARPGQRIHAHRRWQSVAHRAEATAGHPVVRLLEVEVLRRPIWCWPTSVVMKMSFVTARVRLYSRWMAYCGLMIALHVMSE